MSEAAKPKPSAHDLDLVREVLFGADKRQASEEFSALRNQMAQVKEALTKRADELHAAQTAATAKLAQDLDARLKRLEAQMAENAKIGADALANARAALEAQHQAHAKSVADDRAAADSRQAAFIATMRQALDALATPRK
jgi:DNA anti-recombination protein RmuC